MFFVNIDAFEMLLDTYSNRKEAFRKILDDLSSNQLSKDLNLLLGEQGISLNRFLQKDKFSKYSKTIHNYAEKLLKSR